MTAGPKHPETVQVSRADLLVALEYARKSAPPGEMPLLRLRDSANIVLHETPAGGDNDHGITIGDNQATDCFSIYSDNHDGTADTVHICDWPALKAAVDQHQGERGGRL